jgi:ArsR family transcriptional regulator
MSRPDSVPDLSAASDLMKKLAHPSRMLIVRHLAETDATVAELETRLGLKQPSLSQQLAELRGAGIVAQRRDSRSVRYRLIDRNAAALARMIEQQMLGKSDGARDAAPASPTEKKQRNHPALLGAAVFATVHETH